MSWRTIATVMIVLFATMILWTVSVDPLRQVGDSFKEIDDGQGDFDIPGQIDGKLRGYENMFLILAFGVMTWGLWRILRRELTRSRGGL